MEVRGIDDVLVRLARCCNPVPGDEIIGFVTRGRGVSVHRSDCPNARDLVAQQERIIDVEWDTSHAAGVYTLTVQLDPNRQLSPQELDQAHDRVQLPVTVYPAAERPALRVTRPLGGAAQARAQQRAQGANQLVPEAGERLGNTCRQQHTSVRCKPEATCPLQTTCQLSSANPAENGRSRSHPQEWHFRGGQVRRLVPALIAPKLNTIVDCRTLI